MADQKIIHMAIFSLKHAEGAPEIEAFLNDGKAVLSTIPVVQNFQVFHQVSSKTDFDYGFSMEFDSQASYDAYNNHPDHVKFVEERWKVEVDSFQEIDFQAYSG
jgi:hypothetical protein